MNQLVVRFLLKDNHFVDAMMTREQARDVVAKHNAYNLKGVISGEDALGFWSVDTVNLMAIRTSPLSQQQVQQLQQMEVIQGNSGVIVRR